jgi:hypothetical protein
MKPNVTVAEPIGARHREDLNGPGQELTGLISFRQLERMDRLQTPEPPIPRSRNRLPELPERVGSSGL